MTFAGCASRSTVDLDGLATLETDVRQVVTEAAEALIDETGMRRVEVKVEIPENAARWATAGAPGLFNDLKEFWPDCKDDLTYEIQQSMLFMDKYRVWHAASVDKFRVLINEAMADVFEQCDVLLCAVNPHEAFARRGADAEPRGRRARRQAEQRRADDPRQRQRVSGDFDPGRADEERASGRAAGVHASPRGKASA